jgi:hypothetical protein
MVVSRPYINYGTALTSWPGTVHKGVKNNTARSLWIITWLAKKEKQTVLALIPMMIGFANIR